MSDSAISDMSLSTPQSLSDSVTRTKRLPMLFAAPILGLFASAVASVKADETVTDTGTSKSMILILRWRN